jgi:F-type H+-transporting ATPase subunit b
MGLGIDINILVAQIVNFLIVVFVLQKLLYKPVMTMLDKRRREVEEGLKLKADMDDEKEKLVERRKKIVKEANAEAQRIVAAAVADAKKEGEQILTDARTEAKTEMDKRLAEVARERSKIIDEAREKALEYAIVLSEKILGAKLNKAEQERLLKDSIERVQRA